MTSINKLLLKRLINYSLGTCNLLNLPVVLLYSYLCVFLLSSVSLQLSNGLDYGLVNGKRNQEDPVKCTKIRVIITHIFDQPLR